VGEQNFEEVIVVEINNNRILNKCKLINMVTEDFSMNSSG
jgi:hypothetical protein